MSMRTVINIRDDLVTLLESKFPDYIAQVFNTANVTPSFTINTFQTLSLSEAILKKDETGLIWIDSSIFRTNEAGVPSGSALNEIEISVHLLFLEKGKDDIVQTALGQEALSRCIIKETLDLQSDFMINIIQSETLDIGQQSSGGHFLSTGVKLFIKRGI